MIHRLARHLLPINLEHACAASADAAQIVEGKRPYSKPVILEIKLQRVLAGRQCLRSLPAHALEIDQVPQKHWLALEYVEAVSTEATALRDDHALGAALRNVDVGREGVRCIK